MGWPKHVVIDGVDMVCYPTRCYHPLPPGFGWAVLAAMAVGALLSVAFMAFTVWQYNRQARKQRQAAAP